MKIRDWKKYASVTRDWQPSPLLKKTVSLLGQEHGIALDLGAGGMRDTRFLVEQGFDVVAVDSEPSLKKLVPQYVTCVTSSFEDFDFPRNVFDIVNAQWSLPFMSRESLDRVFEAIIDSLRIGGYFTGQFYGIKDEWNTPLSTDVTFLTEDEVRKLLSGDQVVEFNEEKEAKKNLDGSLKFWHVYHIILKKGPHHVTSKRNQ